MATVSIPEQPPAALEMESSRATGRRRHSSVKVPLMSWGLTLRLAYQSLGVVYGDIGTSPMYIYASTFTDGRIKHEDDVLGVLSLIFYTLTLIPLVKYGFVVLRATHNGEGGTFALYSLICKHARVGLGPSQQAVEDDDVASDSDEDDRLASRVKSTLEDSRFAKYLLLFATMFCTSMVIGDGVLTPCISVLSAVGGIKQTMESMTQGAVVGISVAILVGLFMAQRLGTEKVGSCFAPIMCLWFAFSGGVGFYNIVKYGPAVVKAVDPRYIVDYFRRNGEEAWISLGGVVLATTGSEAMFADVGHFSVPAVQLSMCAVVYPALVLGYAGQAAFLTKYPHLVADAFYKSIPEGLYWPVFVVAILASIIASQALITGTFSIVQQSIAFRCFPPLKIVHTSTTSPGQIYVPEVNNLLLLACVAVTVTFQTSAEISNAYGMAVVMVMILTTTFLVLIMVMIWQTNLLLVAAFLVTIGFIELAYLSAVLYKFPQGGYFPLTLAAVLMAVMYTWSDVQRRKHHYELHHHISPHHDVIIATHLNLTRLPGMAIFHSDDDQPLHRIPPIFKHYLANVPALHSVAVLVLIEIVPSVARVPVQERLRVWSVEPREMRLYRCAARYGYAEEESEHEVFEEMLVKVLMEFATEEEEIEVIKRAWKAGVVHMVGESEMVAREGSGIWKRLLIDYGYGLLRKVVRQGSISERLGFGLPYGRTVRVGMTYEL